MAALIDVEQVRRAVALFADPAGVIELRVLNAGPDQTISGYFSDQERLVQAVRSVAAKGSGIYVTLNPVMPDLLARAENRVKPRCRNTTADSEIVRRTRLLLDFDAKRPAGISATNEEHEAALTLARDAKSYLCSIGWPEPAIADSGNGGHLVYAIDLPNDDASATLLQQALRALNQRFKTPGPPAVEVDTAVFNASRISKLYGTVARKGDDTELRPHRQSRILSRPEYLAIVDIEQLAAIAAEFREEPKAAAARSSGRYQPGAAAEPFDLERFMSQYGIRYTRGPVAHQGSDKWVLEQCPFNPDHKAPDSAIFRQHGTGRLGFKCLHTSCADNDWEALRDLYEPNRRRERSPRPAGPPPGPWPPEVREKPEGDVRDELPVTAADVEAAVDAAIAAEDVVAAVRLAAEISALKAVDRAVMLAKLKKAFGRNWPGRDFEKAMKEASALGAGGGNDSVEPDDPEPEGEDQGPNLLVQPHTDAGNGERIALLYGADIRYCVEMKRWLVWDGKRWAVDEFNVMRQRAKFMCRRLYSQAKAMGNSDAQEHARSSEAFARVTAMLGFAETEKGIPISAADLDQHPFLLNCPNGVVNLRDGELLQHNREFMITKLCAVPYYPRAQCSRFMEFIEWAMGAENPEADLSERTAGLVDFLQRAFGYALTSDVSEKAIFIFHGEQGNNGKTTLLTLFRDLLGKDYSGQLVIDTVMSMKQQDSTTRADLADLRGVRFVVTSEVEKEHRLNEGKIKYITAGMGTIKSCRKYENPIEFNATHKLFMDCNHRPVVRGVDEAIWRRLKLVPFEVTISKEKRDERLSEKLRAELPGVLAWAVRGCMAWVKNGLGEPPAVKEASEEWREHDDPLKEFIEDVCDLGPDLWVKAEYLSAAYEQWAKRSRERFPLGREGFNERLVAKGLKQSRGRRIDGKQARCWEGISIKTELSKIARGDASDWGITEEQ